jgi:hypothetical protein
VNQWAPIITRGKAKTTKITSAMISLFFTDITKVSDVVSLPTKDASKDSFPGDHGMM